MNWVFFVFSFFVLATGAYVLAEEAYRLWHVHTWPTAPGRITDIWIDTTDDDGLAYEAKARYLYQVHGVEQRGEVGLMGLPSPWQKRAQRLADYYDTHREIRVAYQPGHPAAHVLADARQRRVRSDAILSGMVGLLLGGGLLMVLIGTLR